MPLNKETKPNQTKPRKHKERVLFERLDSVLKMSDRKRGWGGASREY